MESMQTVQEFSIKLRKNTEVTRNIMRFNAGLNVEFNKWKTAIMEKENNNENVITKLEKKTPMYGAGSEFGRTAKEEAGKHNPDDQPLILSTSEYDKDVVRKFKGTRLGGIAENSSYYIFSRRKNGSIEAFPLDKWYNFQRYTVEKHAISNNEEAEKAYNQKNSLFNSFNEIKHVEDDKHDKDKNKTKESGDKKKDKKKSKKESNEDKKLRCDSPSNLEYSNKHKILKNIFCRKSANLYIPTKSSHSSANTLKRKYSSPDASLQVKKTKNGKSL